MLKAIAAVLKHDLGLPGGMLAEDAALKYQVARSTLFLRLKDWRVGKYVLPTDTSNRSEAQAILSPKAEEKIRDWALLHWRKNDTKSSFQVRQFAAIVAQNQGLVFKTEDGLPSNGWWDRFLRRHPILSCRDTQATESSRLKAQDPDLVKGFFKELEQFVHTNFPQGLQASRVAMLDELGDFISYNVKKLKGIAPRGAREARRSFHLDRTWVTVVGWGFANGRAGPPTYILPNNCSWPCNIASEKVGDAYFIGSENGWVDQDIFLEWLTTVVVKETGCSPSDPLLLFTDGHSSRYTLATIAKARAKGIFIYVIPPHATHFMCVTDKTCHSPYQKRYAALKRVHESTYSSTTWANYVGISSRAYVESFTPSNLINGFRATGLWPINAMEPLMAMVQPDPLQKKQPRAQRASKRKLDLALFELPLELKEKKRSLGPVARVKVFGGCLSGDDVFEQFQAQQKERDEKEQRALARESALAMGRDMRENFFEEFTTKFKEAQVEWTAWKKANVPRAPRRTYTRRTPTTATSTPTTSLPQATSTPSTSMPLLPNDPLLQALTMPPILPSSSLPVMQLDNSYMDPFGTSMFNIDAFPWGAGHGTLR